MGFGATPISTTPLSTNQFPASHVAVPNTANGDFTALEGGPISTDSNSNKTAPASMYLKDGGSITFGAQADTAATTDTGTFSLIALFKRQLQKLTNIVTAVQGILSVQQADLSTGPTTISAAQPVIGTPVSNATVSLTIGQGQSSWMAQITANAGFTSATTIVVDQSIDGGTTWFVASFKVAGSLQNTPVQSVVGPGPLLISGDAASKSTIRLRCSVLNSGESMSIIIRSGAGVGSVGLISSIPVGSNNIGSITIANANTNGQATMTASAPVAIASDQTPFQIKRSTVAVYSLASTVENANGNSGDLAVGAYTEIGMDINTTAQAGTNPTIQYFYERKGADGLYYILWQSAVFTAAANTLSTSIGASMAYNQSLGLTGRLRWVIGGTGSPSFTMSANIYGK